MMGMGEDKNVISDEAVEAAAKAIHEAGDWDEPWTGADWRADCARNEARAALEAAAPHMLPEAWRDGCAEGLACDWDKGAEHLPLNPYRRQA